MTTIESVSVLISALGHSGPTEEIAKFRIDASQGPGHVTLRLEDSPEARTFVFSGVDLKNAVARATLGTPDGTVYIPQLATDE